MSHVTVPPPDLRVARNDVPEGVVAIYQKLLAKSAADRYQTAAELADVLQPFTSTKPAVLAPGDSPGASAADAATVLVPPPFSHIDAASTAQPHRKPSPSAASKLWTARNMVLAVGGAAALVIAAAIFLCNPGPNGLRSETGNGLGPPLSSEAPIAPELDTNIDRRRVRRWSLPHPWPCHPTPPPAIAPFDAGASGELDTRGPGTSACRWRPQTPSA